MTTYIILIVYIIIIIININNNNKCLLPTTKSIVHTYVQLVVDKEGLVNKNVYIPTYNIIIVQLLT